MMPGDAAPAAETLRVASEKFGEPAVWKVVNGRMTIVRKSEEKWPALGAMATRKADGQQMRIIGIDRGPPPRLMFSVGSGEWEPAENYAEAE